MTEPAIIRSMKCPTCKTVHLEPHEVERGLQSQRCPQCSGVFIVFEMYLLWQESLAAAPPPPSGTKDNATAAADEGGPKICPYCGRFMSRFRVALDLPFQIDRCGGCAGLWFESGEWGVLRAHGFHTRLNTIFADSFQHQLKLEEARRQQEERYRTLLGEDDFLRVQEFKRWAESHAKRTVIMAFLDNKDVQ